MRVPNSLIEHTAILIRDEMAVLFFTLAFRKNSTLIMIANYPRIRSPQLPDEYLLHEALIVLYMGILDIICYMR